jgi:hypothetical protein
MRTWIYAVTAVTLCASAALAAPGLSTTKPGIGKLLTPVCKSHQDCSFKCRAEGGSTTQRRECVAACLKADGC